MKLGKLTATLLILLITYFSGNCFAATVTGKVVDAESGEPLVGVNVVLQDTRMGGSTDLDGFYTIHLVPAGTYIMFVTMLGYEPAVSNLECEKDDDVNVDFNLRSTAFKLKDITITGKAPQGSEEQELKDRMKRSSIADAISGEQMKKLPDPDVSDVIRRVTGVSTIGGDPVIRGLDQRYSKVTLNAAQVAGTEPNRSAVSLDLFPTAMMSRVTIKKSFTVDQFGEFGGGNVNMDTWDAFGKKSLNIGVSSSYNSETTFKDFLSYKGGELDFLGFDDGSRSIPDEIVNANNKIVEGGQFGGYTISEMERFSEAFDNNWNTEEARAAPNTSYNFSLTGKSKVFNRQLSYMVSTLYKNGSSMRDIKRNIYKGGDNDEITLQHTYDFKSYKKNITLGGLALLNYEITPMSRINWNILYNRDLENETRYFEGWNDDRGKNIHDTRLRFVGKTTLTTQLSGSHAVPGFLNSTIDWNGTFSRGTRYEPDTREIQYEADPGEDFVLADESQSGSRIYNDLVDNTFSGSFDWVLRPIKSRKDLKLKTGFDVLRRKRDSETRFFQFEPRTGTSEAIDLSQDGESLYNAENLGAISWTYTDSVETEPGQWAYTDSTSQGGFLVREATRPTDSYDALQELEAAYVMADFEILPRLMANVGVRIEHSHQEVNSYELFQATTTSTKGEIDNTDILPAANFTYKLKQSMNLRLALSQTVSRPDFRELSSFEFTDIIGGHAVVGNPQLERALIRNLDLRWEWLRAPSDLIAVSVFYKNFSNPIEKVIQATAQNRVSYENAESANNYGVEFEIRQHLGFISERLNNFSASANLSLIESDIQLSDSTKGIQTSSNRPLHGQSPYLLNAELSYFNPKYGTSASAYLHIYGKRISEVGSKPLPDIYELPHPDVDLTFKQHLGGQISLKAAIENALDPEIRYEQGNLPTEVYRKGRVFSIGMNYSR